MENLFLDVLNLSITAGWLIAAVLLVRLVIRKRAPKWICCLLWGMVGLRLVLPFSLESALSLVPSRETVIPESVYGEVALPVTPPENHEPVVPPTVPDDNVPDDNVPDMPVINTYPEEYIHSGIGIIDNKVNPIIQSTATVTENGKETNILQTVTKIGSIVWVCGMAALAAYAVINYLLLKKRISFSVPEGKDIRKSEAVGSPFILGFFRPRIYLPFGLSAETEAHVIAHERAHLKRKDHWIKPIGYAVLTLHWFNPLVWAAYILLCRDIEYACDEKVVKNMSAEARKAYAEALLECGVSRSMIAACPVAFGEIGVKKRVKNALNYKKPLFWVMILAVVICAAVAVLFLTSPAAKDNETSENVSEEISEEVSETSKDEITKIIPPAFGDTDPLDFNLWYGTEDVIAKHITLDERIEAIKKSESKAAFCIVELTELNFVEDENDYSKSYVDLKFKIVKTIAKSSSWDLEENQEISSFQQFVYWRDVDGITEVRYIEDFPPPFLVCGSYYGVTINDGQVPKDSPEGYDVSVTNLTIPLNDKSINDTEYRNKLYKELQMALGNQGGYYEMCETIIDRYFEKAPVSKPETSEPEPETSEDKESLYRADIDELLSSGRTTAHFYNDYYSISYDRVNDKYSCSSGMFKYKYSDGKITVLFDSGTLTEIDGTVENYNTLIQAYQHDFETKINALFDVLQDEKTEITNFRKVDKTSHAFSIKGTYTYIDDDGKEKTAAVTGDITYYINKGANLKIKLDGETWMSGTLRYTYADIALPLTKIYKTEKYSSMAEFDANVKEFMSFYDSVKLLFNDGNLLNKYLEMSLHRNEPYVPKDKSDTAGGLSSVVVRQLTLGTEENFAQAVIAKRIDYTSYYKNGKDMGGWERNVYSYIENGESHFLDKKSGYGFQGGGYFDYSDEHKLEARTLEDTILWYYDGLLVVMDRDIYTEVSRTEYELYFNCSANFIDTSYTHHSDGTVTVVTDCADEFISNLIYNFMPSEHGPSVKKHRNNTEKETMIFTYGQDGVFRELEFVTDYTCKLTVTDAEGMTLPAKADIFAGNWN